MPQQSPIDLTDSVELELPRIRFAYGPSKLEFMGASRVIQTDRYPANALELEGDWYTLQQFHMHAPSEHKVDGRPFALELHFVHENADGQLAVVGVLVAEGESNDGARELMRLLEGPRGEDVHTSTDAFDPATLLPKDWAFFRYEGSLTTPPYTEGVQWVVLSEPITVSSFQRVQFERRFGKSARELQDLDGRTIKRST